jgi:integrase
MVVQALHRRYDEQEKEKALPGYAESDLIFTNEFGGPLEPRTIAKQFQRLADKAGVPIIRFHDLRHTHATILLTQGVHPKIVSERLGHSEIGVTLDTYSHVIPSMQKKVSDDFDRLING